MHAWEHMCVRSRVAVEGLCHPTRETSSVTEGPYYSEMQEDGDSFLPFMNFFVTYIFLIT